MARNRLYLILFLALTAGYGWLAWALWHESSTGFTPCLIKNVTGIACPSCGSTRAVMLISEGHIAGSLLINPLGLIIAALMVIVPLWLLYDVAASRDTFYKRYVKFENALKIKWVAILLVALIIMNWIWNIQKDL